MYHIILTTVPVCSCIQNLENVLELSSFWEWRSKNRYFLVSLPNTLHANDILHPETYDHGDTCTNKPGSSYRLIGSQYNNNNNNNNSTHFDVTHAITLSGLTWLDLAVVRLWLTFYKTPSFPLVHSVNTSYHRSSLLILKPNPKVFTTFSSPSSPPLQLFFYLVKK